jgi:hypothetical protein
MCQFPGRDFQIAGRASSGESGATAPALHVSTEQRETEVAASRSHSLGLSRKWVDFIIATNAAPLDPTLPVYRLFSADRKRNEWGRRVRIGIGAPAKFSTTKSPAENVNASTHLPQHDGPRIAMISTGWIFRNDKRGYDGVSVLGESATPVV